MMTRFSEKNDISSVTYAYDNFRLQNYLSSPDYLNMNEEFPDTKIIHSITFPDNKNRIIDFIGKRIVILCAADSLMDLSVEGKLNCDILYIEDLWYGNSKQILEIFSFDRIIIGGSVPYYFDKSDLSEVPESKIHDLRTEGAYLVFLD